MRRFLFIALFLIGLSATMNAQSRRPSGPDSRGGFSLANIMKASKEVPDSLLNDSTKSHSRIDAFHLTRMIGDRYVAPMDTDRINFYNTMIPDSRSLAIGYLANNGSPAQTKIFSEKKRGSRLHLCRCLRLLYHHTRECLLLRYEDSVHAGQLRDRRRKHEQGRSSERCPHYELRQET